MTNANKMNPDQVRDYALSEFRALLTRGMYMKEKTGRADMVVNTYIAAGVQFGLNNGNDWRATVVSLRDLADQIEGKKRVALDELMALAAIGKTTLKTMKSGRARGVEVRQQKSEEKLTGLKKVIAPLVEKGWKNEAIISEVKEKKLSPYSPSRTERNIKTIAAQLRKSR